ncbi:MAG: hypothetical protein ABIG95_03175 [Candidatus Woesearchaeota archaeon]
MAIEQRLAGSDKRVLPGLPEKYENTLMPYLTQGHSIWTSLRENTRPSERGVISMVLEGSSFVILKIIDEIVNKEYEIRAYGIEETTGCFHMLQKDTATEKLIIVATAGGEPVELG